jgi:hypothetical protein
MEGLDIERMPFNNDNFAKMRAEIAVLRDIVLKQNAVIATHEPKVSVKVPVKKGK